MDRNKVKPEQASKVLMRMPTLRSFGEGRTRGEGIDTRTHAIRRGSGYGTSEGWFAVPRGDPSRTRVAASASHQAVVTAGARPMPTHQRLGTDDRENLQDRRKPPI